MWANDRKKIIFDVILVSDAKDMFLLFIFFGTRYQGLCISLRSHVNRVKMIKLLVRLGIFPWSLLWIICRR